MVGLLDGPMVWQGAPERVEQGGLAGAVRA
jgi:hypothetical protein